MSNAVCQISLVHFHIVAHYIKMDKNTFGLIVAWEGVTIMVTCLNKHSEVEKLIYYYSSAVKLMFMKIPGVTSSGPMK